MEWRGSCKPSFVAVLRSRQQGWAWTSGEYTTRRRGESRTWDRKVGRFRGGFWGSSESKSRFSLTRGGDPRPLRCDLFSLSFGTEGRQLKIPSLCLKCSIPFIYTSYDVQLTTHPLGRPPPYTLNLTPGVTGPARGSSPLVLVVPTDSFPNVDLRCRVRFRDSVLHDVIPGDSPCHIQPPLLT